MIRQPIQQSQNDSDAPYLFSLPKVDKPDKIVTTSLRKYGEAWVTTQLFVSFA